MKPLTRWVRIASICVRKDWIESRKTIALLTGILVAPMLVLGFEMAKPELLKSMIAAGLMVGPFFYAQSCFSAERHHGTLGLLLSLPVTPTEVVLAKYASLFSMTLFTVNVPGLLLLSLRSNLRLLLYANAAAVLLAAVFMACTVISERRWAMQVPLGIIVIVTIPGQHFWPPSLLRWVTTHPLQIAGLALLLTPVIVSVSTWIFATDLINVQFPMFNSHPMGIEHWSVLVGNPSPEGRGWRAAPGEGFKK